MCEHQKKGVPQALIPKPIGQITEADLNGLVTAAVPERKTLDYKQQLPDPSDAGKRELLADVSSFANTAGGDLIFGMTESTGIPTGVPGVQIANPDQEILRLDSIIRTGLAPRIRHTTRAVPLANGLHVLIIRSERSWYGPHRVIFRGDSRFWGRTSNGKYELDVTDLRNAFLFANTVTEKIAAFRTERVLALQNGNSLVPLVPGSPLVVHFIPVEAFGAMPRLDVQTLSSQLQAIHPMGAASLSGYGPRVNFEGIISIAAGEPTSAYTQIYRNGVIEAVRVGVLCKSLRPETEPGSTRLVIPSLAYEQTVLEYVKPCLRIISQLGLSPPILIGISLINVRGLKMGIDVMDELAMGSGGAIDRDVLMLPEIVVEDVSIQPTTLLKPTLDLVWNACGFSSSLNFDDAGNWVGQRR